MKASGLDVQAPLIARGLRRLEQVAAAPERSHTGGFLPDIVKPAAA